MVRLMYGLSTETNPIIETAPYNPMRLMVRRYTVFYSREILHGILWRLFEKSFKLIASPLGEKANNILNHLCTPSTKEADAIA